ncbi:MAG: SIMPL domain-containing protein [Candidatus Micrarchaeia archaeon]
MAENNSMLLVIGVIVIVLITAGLTYFIAKSGASAGPFQNGTNQTDGRPTITVRGEASKNFAPDLLTIGITVEGNGTTVSDSQKDAAAKVSKLKAALLSKGVKESEIQTSAFYTSPIYNNSCYNCYPRPIPYYGESGTPAVEGQAIDAVYPSPMPPYPYCDSSRCEPIGYKTVHSLTIKSEKTSEGGSLVDSALASDGAKFDYVYFSLKESTRIDAESALQGDAAAAAKSKAKRIADGIGAKLGKVVSINPDQYYPPYPAYAGSGMAYPESPGSKPSEIFPSETTLSSSIVVVYELEQ